MELASFWDSIKNIAAEGWNFISNNISTITYIISGSTVITAATPTRTKNTTLNAVLRLLNILAGNVKKNKNADDKPLEDK